MKLNTQANHLILVPAYNAAKYLTELINRMKASVPAADILVINDGSSDSTEQVISTLGVNFLTNSPNRGKGYTIRRGIAYAIEKNYDYLLTIDADLQHLPEELPLFINADSYSDVSIGTRRISLQVMPFPRWLTNNLTSLIISIFSGRRVRDSQSGYRMMAVSKLSQLQIKSNRYDFESELLFQTGALDSIVAEIPISTVYEGSHSYINPLVDTGRFIKLIWKRILL